MPIDKTIQDIEVQMMEAQGKHQDYLALAFQQALKCDIRDIELVQQNNGNEITWFYRKKIESAEQKRQNGWRPISEKPKDGLCVLVDCPLIESEMTLAFIKKDGSIVSAWDGKPFIGFKPTHFHFLPNPPKEVENND